MPDMIKEEVDKFLVGVFFENESVLKKVDPLAKLLGYFCQAVFL